MSEAKNKRNKVHARQVGRAAQTRKNTRRLLDRRGKILREMRKMEREHQDVKMFTDGEKQTMDIITRVYCQRKNYFEIGDASFAGNTNRDLCTSDGIHTSFVQKGSRAKEKREDDHVREDLIDQ